MPPRLKSPVRLAPASEFLLAAGLSFFLNWALLVALLPAGQLGLLVWAGAAVAALGHSLLGRRYARFAGILAGLGLCGAIFVLWLYYMFSHWVAG